MLRILNLLDDLNDLGYDPIVIGEWKDNKVWNEAGARGRPYLPRHCDVLGMIEHCGLAEDVAWTRPPIAVDGERLRMRREWWAIESGALTHHSTTTEEREALREAYLGNA